MCRLSKCKCYLCALFILLEQVNNNAVESMLSINRLYHKQKGKHNIPENLWGVEQ